MDELQLLVAHLSVGTIWIVVAAILLVYSLRVRGVLKLRNTERAQSTVPSWLLGTPS